MLAFPLDRTEVAPFVADHLEELRDYFLPGDAYRTSGEIFHDEAVRFLERCAVPPWEWGMEAGYAETERLSPEGARAARLALDSLQQLADQEYNARVWHGGRVPATPTPGPTNLREEDTPAWNAWHNRTRYAQMTHTATPHDEVLEATDPVDGHTVTFAASDLEPALQDGTGNQLSATEEYLVQRHGQRANSGVGYNRWLGHLRCRSLTDVQRFDTYWTWHPNDPTADEACMDMAKRRAQRCLRAALTLPQRYDNRFVRWSTLDLLLDRLSPCLTSLYAAGLVNAVFQADPAYQARIDRLAAAKGCLGRRKAFPDTGIEPLTVKPRQLQPLASDTPSPDGHRTTHPAPASAPAGTRPSMRRVKPSHRQTAWETARQGIADLFHLIAHHGVKAT